MSKRPHADHDGSNADHDRRQRSLEFVDQLLIPPPVLQPTTRRDFRTGYSKEVKSIPCIKMYPNLTSVFRNSSQICRSAAARSSKRITHSSNFTSSTFSISAATWVGPVSPTREKLGCATTLPFLPCPPAVRLLPFAPTLHRRCRSWRAPCISGTIGRTASGASEIKTAGIR